jgi:LacI family transcriptional regulator
MKDVARMAGVSTRRFLTSSITIALSARRFGKSRSRDKRSQLCAVCAGAQPQAQPDPHHRYADHRQYQPFYSELVRGVERSCFERGYSLVLCNTEGDEQRMNRNLETLMQKRVDGLLLLCTETHQPSKEIMQRYPSVPR